MGGWGDPWPNVAELARALPHEKWTLVGGLMTQMWAVHKSVSLVRPTNDVDVVLHVEAHRGVVSEAAAALEGLGYHLERPLDDRKGRAHRFSRQGSEPSIRASAARRDVVDILVSDHHAPQRAQRLRGYDLVQVEGGTRALRLLVEACLHLDEAGPVTINVPSIFGALVLKAAAARHDPREQLRHLQDAAVLLAALDDPFQARENFRGSDRSRMLQLAIDLDSETRAWSLMTSDHQQTGRAALRILTT